MFSNNHCGVATHTLCQLMAKALHMMKRITLFVFLIVCIGSSSLLASDTVVFVVRHAEKASESGDSDLSEAGKKRATQLMETLKNLRVDAVYVTEALRTKMTAEPLRETLGIMLKEYSDPSQAWADGVLAEQRGKRVLIVGHAPTVPQIVSRLAGQDVSPIGNEYDNLFIVTVSGDKKSMVRLKYGSAAP